MLVPRIGPKLLQKLTSALPMAVRSLGRMYCTALNGIWVQIPSPSPVMNWKADKVPLELSTFKVNSSPDPTVARAAPSHMKGT